MTDNDLLTEIRDRFSYASSEWRPIHEEGKKDMRYLAGDCWEPSERKAREEANRPVVSPDELNQYVNQLINDIRQNKRAIKATPQGAGATDQTAELRANLIRQIEYRSNAQMAYTTMFENAAQRGYGFARVISRYVSNRSFDQELVIDPIVNPDLVTPDPDSTRTDGSDFGYLFYHESMRRQEFTRKHPKAKIRDFSADLMATATQWVSADRVQVAEYWTIEKRQRTLLLLKTVKGPVVAYLDELEQKPAGEHILKHRDVDEPTVRQYLTNGVEILERTEWKGKSIPWIACFGKVIYIDRGSGSKRELLSLIRLARDPQMLYAYYRTQQAEMAGMIPKVPVIGYVGQFRGVENDWQKAPHEPMAFIEANARTEATGGETLPLPSRLAYDAGAHLQALELCAEGARRAIQAAVGASPLPTQAQRRNEKSGIALQHMEDSAQKGSFHFVDHYDEGITRAGQILEENISWTYDTARDVTVRKPDDSSAMVRINDPSAVNQDSQGPQRTDVGEHDITISVGPKMDSEREAAAQFADLLMTTPMAPAVADLAIRLKNLGPLGDEMADRVTPPQFKKPKDDQVDPQQLQQQLQQLSQQHDLLVKELDAKNMALQTDQVKTEAQYKLQIALQHMKNAAQIASAWISATKGMPPGQEGRDEAIALSLEQAHEAVQAHLDRAHEAAMAAAGAGAGSDQSAQDHQQTLEQGQQAADLAPVDNSTDASQAE